MSDKIICPDCNREFSVKGFHTHYARTHLGDKKYSSGNNGKYEILSSRWKEKYYQNPKTCLQCKTVIPFKHKANKFCDHSCAAKFNNNKRIEIEWSLSIESRKRISEKLSGKISIKPYYKLKICENCNNEFQCLIHGYRRQKRFCSKSCGTTYVAKIRYEKLRLTKTERENYKRDCNFRFSLKDYPAEFDFTLLEQYGIYKAKNRGDNLTGVSRDHMVSVMWGWKNNVPTEHIAHPANCRLIRHSENASKGTKNHITYEELLARITLWNERYNLSCTITKFSVC
jgi:hypothetical protein